MSTVSDAPASGDGPAEIGPPHRLIPAIKSVTGVERVYHLAVMERAAHFHLWLVPKRNVGEPRGAAYLAQQPPLTATRSDAEGMAREIKAVLERY